MISLGKEKFQVKNEHLKVYVSAVTVMNERDEFTRLGIPYHVPEARNGNETASPAYQVIVFNKDF